MFYIDLDLMGFVDPTAGFKVTTINQMFDFFLLCAS